MAIAHIFVKDAWLTLGKELRTYETKQAQLIRDNLNEQPSHLVEVAQYYPVASAVVHGVEKSALRASLLELQSALINTHTKNCDRRYLDAFDVISEIHDSFADGDDALKGRRQLQNLIDLIEPVHEKRDQRMRDAIVRVNSREQRGKHRPDYEVHALPDGALKALLKRLTDILTGLVGPDLDGPATANQEACATGVLQRVSTQAAPLLALVVHLAIPWWLPANKLPEAVKRYERLLTRTEPFRREIVGWVDRVHNNQSKRGDSKYPKRARRSRLKIIRAIAKELLLELGLPRSWVKESSRKTDDESDDVSSEDENTSAKMSVKEQLQAKGDPKGKRVKRRFKHPQVNASREKDPVLPRKGYPWEW